MLSPPRRNRPISFLFKLLGATIFLSISLFFFSHSHVSRFHHEIDAPNDLFEYLFSATSQFLKAASSGADDHHPQDSTGDNPWQPVFLINNTLTKEGAIKASIAPDGHSKVPVLVTVANNQYRAMLMNWIKHIQEIKYHNVLIGAMDDELLQFLNNRSIPAFSVATVESDFFGWGSSGFNRMRTETIRTIQAFVHYGVDVLFSDLDVAWLRNPIDFFARYPKADVIFSTDRRVPTIYDGGLEYVEAVWLKEGNVGVILFRPSAVSLVDEWVQIIEENDKLWDQEVFNRLVLRNITGKTAERDHKHEQRLFRGYNETLSFGILPVELFPSGHYYFVQHRPENKSIKPYMLHPTFCFSEKHGKINRLREAMAFYDEPPYYDHHNGFISVDNNVPQRLLNPIHVHEDVLKVKDTGPHFKLVNPQLLIMRAAFAIATVLDRAVVLPELWCGFDKYWQPHLGVIPGSNFALPYQCPADHVLDLTRMSQRDTSQRMYGPYIEWRESSFLKNPANPLSGGDVLHVNVCVVSSGGGGDGSSEDECADGSVPVQSVGAMVREEDGGKKEPTTAAVWLRAGMNETQLKMALKHVAKGYKVLHFVHPVALWGGFGDVHKANRFKDRINEYATYWCCVADAEHNHIFYDFFWDVKNHTDRFGRKFEDVWRPTPGP